MITLWVLGSLLVAYFGRHRRFGFIGFLILSLVLSPVLVGLMLLITGPKASRVQRVVTIRTPSADQSTKPPQST